MTGHAIEARVYAEDPARGFLPTGGDGARTVVGARIGPGASPGRLRDLAAGTVVGSDYDPMLAKVIAHAEDRPAHCGDSIARWPRPRCSACTTNIEFLRFLLADPDVRGRPARHRAAGPAHPRLRAGPGRRRRADRRGRLPLAELLAAGPESASAVGRCRRAGGSGSTRRPPSGCALGERTDHVYLTGYVRQRGDGQSIEDGAPRDAHRICVGRRPADRHHRRPAHRLRGGRIATRRSGWLGDGRTSVMAEEVREAPVRPDDEHSGDAELVSPMPGSVVAVGIGDGRR